MAICVAKFIANFSRSLYHARKNVDCGSSRQLMGGKTNGQAPKAQMSTAVRSAPTPEKFCLIISIVVTCNFEFNVLIS
jgi:hypothetical protein